MEQGTPEWYAARAGKFTSSSAEALMKVGKRDGKPLKGRGDLIDRLVVERIADSVRDNFTAQATERGRHMEVEAREMYAFETGHVITEVAIVVHPTMDYVSCSPDGLIGDDGGVELKCPANVSKHLEALLDGAHVDEYFWQVQQQLFVTGRKWWDVVCYDPRFPDGKKLAIKTVKPDAEAQAAFAKALPVAEQEVVERVKQVMAL